MRFISESSRLFVILVFLGGFIAIMGQGSRIRSEFATIRNQASSEADDEASIYSTSKFSDDLRLLMFGEEGAQDDHLRWLEMYQEKPDSPLYYARYLQESDSLPEGFHETVSRIAPDNGWFDIWEIYHRSAAVFSKNEQRSPKTKRKHFAYEVHDEEAMKQLLSVFHAAAAKKEFTSYFQAMQDALAQENPEPHLWMDQFSYLANTHSFYPPVNTSIACSNFIGAANHFFVIREDLEGFLEFEKASTQISIALFQDSHALVEALVSQTHYLSLFQTTAEAAKHFGLAALEAKYQKLEKKLQHRIDAIRDAGKSEVRAENNELIKKHGALLVQLGGLASRLSENPRAIDAAELLPSCRAENAMITRLFAGGWFVIFLIMGIALWIRSRRFSVNEHESIQRHFTSRAASAKWSMVVFGVMIPASLFLITRHLTPLGQLNYSFSYSGTSHLSVPIAGLGILIFTCLLVTARWIAEPDESNKTRNSILIALPTLSILLIGFHPSVIHSESVITLSGVFLLSAIIGLFAFRRGVAKTERRRTIIVLMIPASFLTAGLLGIWTWALTIEEKKWMAKDEFSTPQKAFISKDEARITKRFLAELEDYLP